MKNPIKSYFQQVYAQTRRMLSFFLTVVLLVMSVPQTALAVEADGENAAIVNEIIGEDKEAEKTPGTDEISEGSEETPGTDEGTEDSEGTPGTDEGTEDSEGTPGTDEGTEDSEGTPGTGEGTEGSEGTPGSDEGTEGSEGTSDDEEDPDADTETDADEDPETDREIEKEIEESVEEITLERREFANGSMAAGETLTIDYDDYSLTFTIKNNLNDYYASVTGFTSKNAKTNINLTIPSYVSVEEGGEQLPVKDIGERAFYGKTEIEKLCFEDDPQLVSIQNGAFKKCTNLAYLELPDSIESIGMHAFFGNSWLGTQDKDGGTITDPQLVLPSGLKSLGSKAFQDCDRLTKVVVPASLTTVPTGYYDNGSYTNDTGPFYLCDSLIDITIEEGMKTIPERLFAGKIRDTDTTNENGELVYPITITIPDSVTTIGESAFRNQGSMTHLLTGENSQLKTIEEEAFFNCWNLTYVDLPDSITSIGIKAFLNDAKLGTRDRDNAAVSAPQINLPKGLESLGSKAFGECKALVKVVVPAALNKVPLPFSETAGPFYLCDSLIDITIEEGMKTIPAHLFEGRICLTNKDDEGNLIKQLTIKIPGSVTSIEEGAFKNQGSMTRFLVGENPQLKTIGEEAFYNCVNLTYVDLPDSITSIGIRAFSGDARLGTRDKDNAAVSTPQINLPIGLESLGSRAFQDCDALVKVVVPATLNKVPLPFNSTAGPFYLCDSLSDITIEEGIKTIPAHLFEGHIRSTDEKNENGELLYPITIKIPDSVTVIGEAAFKNQGSMTCCLIGENSQLKTIENGAFKNCKNLAYIELPNSIESIGKQAFLENTVLGTKDKNGANIADPQLVLPSGLKSLGSKAFQDCDALKKVVVPNTLTKVPTGSWDGATGDAGPFYRCDNLVNIAIAEGIKTIPSHLFNGSILPTDVDAEGNLIKQLTIEIPGSVSLIEEGAFYSQRSMTHCLIGEDSQLNKIGKEAFYDCLNLAYINLPDSVTSIGGGAFSGDVKLGTRDKEGNPVETPELKFSVQLVSLGEKAFSSCTALQKIEFEVNNYYTHKQTLGEAVFLNCTSLKTIKFGNKIQAIPNKAFSGCTALEELEISYGVKSIGTNVFYNCHELKYLFIPSSVTTIKTTQSELAFCYEQGLKIYVEKGESAAATWAGKMGFETEVGIYRTREEFPDEAFFLEMNTQRFDKNLDTRLTLRELEQIHTLELSKLGIEDMTGLQILTYVENLNCSGNRITALDPSALTLLKALNCADNKISALDVSKNPLETLNCENNAILAIDLSGVATLKDVTLGEQRGSLAINYDSAYGEYVLPLKEIYSASYNKACISEPSDEDVKNPTNNGLVWYEAYDVPDNISYKYTTGYGSESGKAVANVHVTITNAGITLTDKEYPDAAFRGKVMELADANKNGLISKTEERSCSELQISGADISDLTGLDRLISLRVLNCADNHLKMLDISRNPAIEVLDCSKNDLKELNTQNNLSLKELTCADNKITRLNTSQNTLLEILECGNNRIAVIEIADNQHLDTLRSGNQQITVVRTVAGDSAYLDVKTYDERFDYAKATDITVYLDNTAIKDADVKISGDGIVVPSYVEKISYQYSIPGFRAMYVTVKLVDELEEEPEEEPVRNISNLTISAFTDKIYTGEETSQVITIYDGIYRLKAYKDYTEAYENNIEVGTASVTIKGIGKYSGTYTGNYEIKPEWSEISIKNIPDQVYQNKEITPAFTVKLGKKILVKDRDYVVDYTNNKDAGVGTIVINGMGQYESAGMRELAFNIVECNISKTTFLPIADEIYDGTAKVPVLIIRHNGLLRTGIDYTTSYSKNIKAGKGIVTVKGIGNYKGTVKKTFSIKKYDLSKLTNEEILVEQKVPFSMTGAKAAVEIRTSSGITLTEGTDYTLSYSGNKKAGVTDAKVVIKGKGSCSGKKTMTFEVMPQSIDDAALQIQIAVAQKDSQGRQIKPKITITQDKKKLREGENKDYTVTYNAEDTVRSGKVTVTITGKNNYGGETTADFIIVDKLITKAKIKGVKNYEYSGEEIEQSENDITVMLGKEEVPANCYDISYDQNIEAGNKAVMTVTAAPETCNYEFGGSVTAKFKITPVKFALSKMESRVVASLAKSSIVYNGQKQSPDVIVTDELSNIVLKKDVDYVASYSNNQNVGTKGKVTVKGKGNYSGTIVIPFSIEEKNMTEYEDDFTVMIRNSAYTGKKISPRITVMDGDTALKLNKDYKLEIERDDPNGFDGKIKDKGRYTITIKGAGNYTGELSGYGIIVY